MKRLVSLGGLVCLAACATTSDLPSTIAGDASPAADGATPSDGGARADAELDATVSDAPDANACPAAGTLTGTHAPAFSYGRHYPSGLAAVAYAYGADGMWKEMKPLEYTTNYYAQYATTNHPEGKSALIAYANGTHFTTARDANGHLLGDLDHSGEIDSPNGGFAFHEHNGRGAGGASSGGPFTNFWFDDNWLARYMSSAYGRPLPNGLSDYTDFTRWRILGGDATAWTPYGSSFFDTLALDGLYELAKGNVAGASSKWDAVRDKSGFTYDGTSQRYAYPSIQEPYHMGLFKILTDQLMEAPALSATKRAELLQHSIALRSDLLSIQETSGASALGWRSDISSATSLMNIESLTVGVLALGARADSVFEAGSAPLKSEAKGYFVRPHHVISAVTGTSTAGLVTTGPGFAAPPGSYDVDFFLRAPSPTGTVATVSIRDTTTSTVLATHDVPASEMAASNAWTRVTLTAVVPAGCHVLDFDTAWTGTANLDVAAIRVR
ncbi:MAG: hypothetical protein JWM74_5047 [Myxococcaceae bacterium]|nr:hypothetical protein [Myxococcaceae bacterium]